MSNPYHITGPALLSISGGRTSGFMLRQIIDAHGGKLPDDVIPVFCNTGKEHEATMMFLKEMGKRWTEIVWLEYRRIDGAHSFAQVDYCTASRSGEPFAQMIDGMTVLPNPVARNCTKQLKVSVLMRYADSMGWDGHAEAIGLRADEPHRVHRMTSNRVSIDKVFPIFRAGHTEADVLAFWKSQPFDLELPGGDNTFGNCDLCFLKSRAKIEKILQTNPKAGEWWARQEERMGSTFRRDRPTYRQMMTQLTVEGRLFDDAVEDDTLPCQCTD